MRSNRKTNQITSYAQSSFSVKRNLYVKEKSLKLCLNSEMIQTAHGVWRYSQVGFDEYIEFISQIIWHHRN